MGTAPVLTDDGRWVNGDYAYLAEIVRDYDSNLALGWIPPESREVDADGEALEYFPYAILDTRTNSTVFKIREDETPVDVLERLFRSDDKHGNVLDRLDERNRAQQIWQAKQKMEAFQEAEELAKYMIQSPINYMKILASDGTLVKLDDQRRRIE